MANNAAAVAHLDRQVTDSTSGVSSAYSSPTTTWTIPYSVATDQATDGYLAICRTDTNVWLNPVVPPLPGVTVTRPASNQIAVAGLGNLTSVPILIGLLYSMSYELSTIYFRNQKGGADQRGRLRLGYLNISYEPMTDMTVIVTPQGRSSYSYVFNDPTAQQSDSPGDLEIAPFRVPIQCRNEDATIVISNNTPGSTRLVAFDWEGMFVVRSRAE
jgi:hypothetical protein